MYARSNTIQATPQSIDAGLAQVTDEVMPAIATMPGFIGVSMLADRESGRCIVTTSWDSEESMRASEEAVRGLRTNAQQAMGAGDTQVDRWEIAMMHRAHGAHDGACARVIWTEGDPARADETLSTFRMAMLPRIEELPGFCSLSLLVDRQTGRGAMTVTYDSREDMQRAADAGRAMREEFTNSQGMRTTDMADFDVLLHHLRVPEMA